MDIEKLVHIAETLEKIVLRCFGPDGGQVLFVRDTGDIHITKDGCRILESLLLDHPAARLMVQSMSAHCRLTGDGAKSFILLLAAMLRGVRAETRGQGPARRHWLVRGLARLEREVLEPVLGRELAPHCAQALSARAGQLQLPSEQAARVLGAYFRGKVGLTHAPLLSQLACDYIERLGGGQAERGLGLAADCFPGLQVTVPGLPVSSSRVLEGLLLSRSTALPCSQAQTQSPTRVLAVGKSLLPILTQAGSTLKPEGPAGLARARGWTQAQAEETLARLQALGVRLLLSGPRQPDYVLEQAQRRGLSVVHCLPDEELALLRRLTGAETHYRLSQVTLLDTLPASFVSTAPILPRTQLLLGLPGLQGCQPHCLLVCAPTIGLARQLQDALHGAFKLLRLLLPETADLHGRNERQGIGELGREGERQGIGVGREGDRQGTRELGRERQGTEDQEIGSNRQWTGEREIGSEKPGTGQWVNERQVTGDLRRESKGKESGELGGVKQGTVQLVRNEDETKSMQTTEEGQHYHAGVPLAELGSCELPAGSVLPTGGTFEFLVHHYLCRVSGSLRQINTRVACRIVADALLNIPRHLHPWAERGGAYLQAQADFAANHREQRVRPVMECPLEVVAAKQRLLVSVLQCLRSLLTIDSIIPVHGKLRKNLQRDGGDSE
ncbi:Bardet-Biedl syndrome 10 protein [Stegostoma tigrinum]|uniref:Bardet-Biedl syndrome 10 protein n=1 Tax=Stegostoma tigrinum TaxID=3053191 RepID=UPI0028701F25|nr:Bardet-Biedl syndrome 10 protein [Stegostoma tigrinum]